MICVCIGGFADFSLFFEVEFVLLFCVLMFRLF